MSKATLIISVAFLFILFGLIVRSVKIRSIQLVTQQTSDVAQSEKKNKHAILSAWVPVWEEERVITSLEDGSISLDSILPGWYFLTDTGEVIEVKSDKKLELKDIAREKNIKVIPTISNDAGSGFDPNIISRVLSDKDKKSELADNLVKLADENDYYGWDLDFEQIYADDKDDYSDFLDELSRVFSQNNLLLSVTVHAKSGKENDWVGTKGQDWVRIGKYANEVRIMAYDFHEAGSSPGPVTPWKDLVDTLKYAVNVLPKDKIVVGLPTYGYDWSKGRGVGYNFVDITKNLTQKDINWERDPINYSLFASYEDAGLKHEVWFEDATSYLKKRGLAETYGITKFCLWHLGGEDPDIWKVKLN